MRRMTAILCVLFLIPSMAEAQYRILRGSTDVSINVMLVDPTSGDEETGLTITDLDMSVAKAETTLVKADATALDAITSAHADWKMYQVDATNAPGLYRCDWPDFAFSGNYDFVDLVVKGAAINTAVIGVQLYDDAVPDSLEFISQLATYIKATTALQESLTAVGARATNIAREDTLLSVSAQVAAARAKVNGLTFTTANKVDARIDYVGANAVTATSDFKADVSALALAESLTAIGARLARQDSLNAVGLRVTAAQADLNNPDQYKATVSGLATADTLTALSGQVAAIKAKTNSLTFTTAGKVDSRVDYVGANAVTTPDDFKADVSGLSTFDAETDSVIIDQASAARATSSGGGDATAANQTTIINALATAQADLDNPSQYKATGFSTFNAETDSVLFKQEGTARTAKKVWDYATTSMTVTGSAGKLITDRIDAAISSVSGSGTGDTEVNYTITKTGTSTPIPDVAVDVRSVNSGSADIVARQYTNDAGKATFMLDSGVMYYLWRTKAGYTFANPDSIEVP